MGELTGWKKCEDKESITHYWMHYLVKLTSEANEIPVAKPRTLHIVCGKSIANKKQRAFLLGKFIFQFIASFTLSVFPGLSLMITRIDFP